METVKIKRIISCVQHCPAREKSPRARAAAVRGKLGQLLSLDRGGRRQEHREERQEGEKETEGGRRDRKRNRVSEREAGAGSAQKS